MDPSNEKCNGFKLTLKSCYKVMNSPHFNSSITSENICDEPFNQYILCLQVIYYKFKFNYIIGSDHKNLMDSLKKKKIMRSIKLVSNKFQVIYLM